MQAGEATSALFEPVASATATTTLPVRNVKGDAALEFLLIFGRPHGRPFFKVLGYGGALMDATEARVRAAMAAYERDPPGFGRAEGGAPPASLAARYGFCEGYKDRGDALRPGVRGRWRRLEKSGGGD